MSTEARFTPGPWNVADDTGVQTVVQQADSGMFVATVEPLVPGQYDAEVEANAALIAAAPEMYQALESALNVLSTPYVSGANKAEIELRFRVRDEAKQTIRAVLAKARGEQ